MKAFKKCLRAGWILIKANKAKFTISIHIQFRLLNKKISNQSKIMTVELPISFQEVEK